MSWDEQNNRHTTPPDLPIGLRPRSNRNAMLRSLLDSGTLVVAVGAFDVIGARLVELAKFPAVYITGSGVSMSLTGAPDVGYVSFTEVLDRVKRIADAVSIPVIADADTGYGGPLNVIRTVREFEQAGVSAIQLEDQAWPKKCGHETGRRVVSTAEMIARLKAAVDARIDDNFIIIARTDARTDWGIDAAIERALAYQEAGADVIFVESPETEAEMQLIHQHIRVPTLANMVEGGRTPLLPHSQLQEIGYDIVIHPNTLTRVFAKAGLAALEHLREHGSTESIKDQMLDHRALWGLFEYEKWIQTEARYEVKS